MRETPPADAADKAREDNVAAVSAAEAPAATTDIHPGLDSSTKQSLGRLALLIRDAAVKPVGDSEEKSNGAPSSDGAEDRSANEDSNEENSEHEKPAAPVHKPMRPLSAVLNSQPPTLDSPEEPDAPPPTVAALRAVPPLEESTKESFPAVLRLEKHLQIASRKRGAKIYSQQKNKDAVELILSELDRRKAG